MFKHLPRLNDSQDSQQQNHQQQQQQHQKQTANSKNKSSIFVSLPLVEVPNSSLVRQRVSAKDCLAAATVTAGASLPLMIGGGRAKCALNPVDQHQHQPQSQQSFSHPSGPQNTALRAEQRRQNMVSVVRPVMSLAARPMPDDCFNVGSLATKNNQLQQLDDFIWSGDFARELSVSSGPNGVSGGGGGSIMDDFIKLDSRASRDLKLFQGTATNSSEDSLLFGCGGANLHQQQQLTRGCRTGGPMMMPDEFSERNARQQLILLRREEFELNRTVRRPHKFLVSKMDERKRYLQIIQSVWAQKDFKSAIEKLVDIYQCGLVFTAAGDGDFAAAGGLCSLQTPLVVDVIGMIVLRPKLWNLDVCQLVLPIIVNDLLGQSTKYENHIEVAIKSLKLILSYFSPVIKSTLEASGLNFSSSRRPGGTAAAGPNSNVQSVRASSLGVDLSHEDRVAKCLSCYKLLLEAQCLISKRCCSSARETATATTASSPPARLLPMFRELNQSLSGFIHSLTSTAKSDSCCNSATQ